MIVEKKKKNNEIQIQDVQGFKQKCMKLNVKKNKYDFTAILNSRCKFNINYINAVPAAKT